MAHKALRTLVAGLAATALAAAVCGSAAPRLAHAAAGAKPLPPTAARGQGAGPGPGAQAAGSRLLPTAAAAALTPAQTALLRQVASRTWDFLSGPDLDPRTHLPLPRVPRAGAAADMPAPGGCAHGYANPALIGTYLTSIVAARDLGLATPATAEKDAAQVLAALAKLPQDEGFTVAGCGQGGDGTPAGTPGYVSTVDNGWLAQGLLVAQNAFPQLAAPLAARLNAMQWQLLYDRTKNVLYNGYKVGGHHSPYTYDNAYCGPRIAEYMAIGSGKVPGALWWGPHRTPPRGHNQRQTPQGHWTTYTDPQNHQRYQVFEGHYTYGGITFVPTFDGSLYQALAPDLVFPEQTAAPASLGPNDRNTALAQAADAAATRAPAWGWAPAAAPGTQMRYRNYGVPDLASDQGPVAHTVVAPYAAFLALPIIPQQAYSDIAGMIARHQALYTRYGFLDSLDITTGQVAAGYLAASQMAVLMSIDDALDHGRLQTYAAASPYQQRLAPYMHMESYSIAPANPPGR